MFQCTAYTLILTQMVDLDVEQCQYAGAVIRQCLIL